MPAKVCNGCRESKSLEDFYRRSDARDGRAATCKACQNPRLKAYASANRERIRAYHRGWSERTGQGRKRSLRRYGLTPEQYATLLESQGGGCAICHKKPTERALPVDHDHATGAVRGILCDRCNLIVGVLESDAEVLKSAAAYIQQAELVSS